MASASRSARPSRAAQIIGWVLGVLPCLLLGMSAFMKLSRNPQAVDGFKAQGYPDRSLLVIGVVEVACTALYLFPRTAVLGAILLTGYLGGATNVHVRLGEPVLSVATPVVLGILLWLGLYLREPRLRPLVPWRK